MFKQFLLAALLCSSAALCAQDTLFFDGFETGQFNPQWTPRPNLNGINGLVEVASGTANTGQYAAWLGKTSDAGGLTTNALDLRLNLQGQTKVEMTFWIYDNSDETHMEDGLYFSDNNGVTFKKVLDFRPNDWCNFEWGQFPPIEVHKLAAQHGLTLNSQFVIRFQQRGEMDFSGSSDGLGLDDVNVYVPCTAYFPVTANTPFCDGFETGKLGCNWAWRFATATNILAAVPTRPSNFVSVISNTAYTGQFAVAMGKTCDDGFATNALDLHLNLQGLSDVEMTFWLYDNNDETQVDDGIYFSDNGGVTFKKVFDFRPSDYCDYQYGEFPPLRIQELAAKNGLSLTNQFIIRFQQHDDLDFSGSPDGLILDDIKVYVPCTAYFQVSENNDFFDDFENGNLGCNWAWRFADATNTLAAVPTRPSNIVEVISTIAYSGQYSVAMGKSCDDGFATNALDLHLNLQGQPKVELSFRIYDYNDETQIDDGIYFSDNGGISFKKVFDFRPSDWCDYQYGILPPLQVHELAAKNGLSLTSQFIIRFQQHDDLDFSGSPDGLILDDVHVYVPNLIYASLPFSDGFETGDLQPMWARRFADQTALPATNVTRPSNLVEVFSNTGNTGQYAVSLGKICDDGFATNALDLHLNLNWASSAQLSFWINVWAEETHIQDGIWISDNGGTTFTKVYSFDFDTNEDYEYYQIQLDLGALANTYDFGLSDQFIIRFQQHDDQDFSGQPDGYFLDDINVTGTISNTTSAGQPSLVHIFPNPARDVLAVSGLPTQTTTFQVHDAQGSIVQSGQVNGDFQLETNTLSPGLYFVECRQGAGVWQGRFVKL